MNQTSLSSFIWSVADLLRGNFKQSDYGKVILPFTVLRRMDCVLAPTKQKVLAEVGKKQAAGVNPAPCWYCSGLIRQFNIGTVIVGESVNFDGHLGWLKEAGVKVIELNNAHCIDLMKRFIEKSPDIWFEDIGECK